MKVLAGGQFSRVPTYAIWGLWVEFSLSTAPRPVSQALLETVEGFGVLLTQRAQPRQCG